MRDFHIGDRVTFSGRPYFVRGFSPMSVTPPTIHLEDEQTGEELEVAIDQLTGAMQRGRRDKQGVPRSG